MSTIVKFFVAKDEEAIDALGFGPDSSFRVEVFGNFDAEEALLAWEAGLSGVPFDSLVESDLPEVVAEVDGGPMLLRVSDALASSLAAASRVRIHELAASWVESADGINVELPAAAGILRSLMDLARSASEPGVGVYCWIS